MTIHKRTKLTPVQRQKMTDEYLHKGFRVCELARKYDVSRVTVYKVIRRGRLKDFSVHSSVNKRFRCLEYGLKRLTKVAEKLEAQRKARAKRYEKSYPGEMLHGDTKQLPLIKGQPRRESLHVAIDDFSRELYAAILPDQTQLSSANFLKQVLDECPYTIEQWYSDNGKEYKGNIRKHEFMKLCREHHIDQRFTKVRTPKTNGKAERVIGTIMHMWHDKTQFKSSAHRKQELIRFVNWYNTVKPHRSLKDRTPMETLIEYFYPQKL